jgi:DNA helicase-2/ATP-dependent DNA helicase PcrA
MEEGIFPHFNSSETEEEIEEERRLCYVGFTRAMERIFVTSAELRRTYAGIEYKTPSRFILEIPSHKLNATEYGDSYSSAPPVSRRGYRSDFAETRYDREKQSLPHQGVAADSESRFKTRDMVLHPKYGKGKIMRIEGSGDNVKLTIVFSTGEKKVFLEKYTPLEKIG